MYYKECYCIIINYLFKYPTQIWEGGLVQLSGYMVGGLIK
jgi:hypothetical protein